VKFLPLLWRNLTRKKVRTTFTLLSILVSFLLFGLLSALERGFGQGAELAGVDRLITMHKVSLIQLLPLRYRSTIEAVEGVEVVGHFTWFGGYYQDFSNQFAQFAVDVEALLRLNPELSLSEEQKQAWLANRTGAIVAQSLADRFEWKVGDRIPLKATIFQLPGNPAWEFTIEGIFDDTGSDAAMGGFLFHYDYLNRAGFGVPGGELNLVGYYVSRIADPDRAAEVAAAIDRRFANSEAETKTSTEKAFAQSFANQVGNVRAIALGIIGVVFFTLLLVAGNTVAQSVRERTAELAVLKAFGFTDAAVTGLVLAEALVLTGVGGGVGLAGAWLVAGAVDLQGGLLPPLYVPAERLALGCGLILLFGLVSAALPAWQALRLRIVDALRSA
jgi:putative ABC transport system permease protein